MGMFDSFYFDKGVLPANKEYEDMEFQTKDLECLLDVYKVDANLYVTKSSYDDEEKPSCEWPSKDEPLNFKICVYSYNFGTDPSAYQDYEIEVVDNKLVKATKLSERGYDD